jgi:hypothetical protein
MIQSKDAIFLTSWLNMLEYRFFTPVDLYPQTDSILIAKRFGCKVVGVDISPDLIDSKRAMR